MTQEKLQNIIRDTRVSSAIYSTGDQLCDLVSEIYFEGYKDWYNHLKDIVSRNEPRIFGCGSDEFFATNMDKIRRRADAIFEAEGSDDNEEK